MAVVTVLMASCGGDRTDDASAIGLETYAQDLCGAAATWMDSLGDRNSQLQEELDGVPSDDTGATRDVIVSFLGEAVQDTETLIDEVSRLSPPDVNDGAQIHQSLLTAFTQARDLFADARDRFSQLDDDDATGLAQALNDLAAAPAQAGTEIAGSVQGLANEELTAAMRATPACAEVSG